MFIKGINDGYLFSTFIFLIAVLVEDASLESFKKFQDNSCRDVKGNGQAV